MILKVLGNWASVILCSMVAATAVLLWYPVTLCYDSSRNSLHRIAILWAKSICFLNRWDFEIQGQENIPTLEKAVVVVANHTSQADILALFLMDFPFRWVSKHTLFRIPLMGWAMWCVGYVSLNRNDKKSQMDCMKKSHEHLSEGKSMVFFPEGTRSLDGKMLSFKSGAFRLAKSAGVDILPVTLLGTEKLLPKGKFAPGRTKVVIVVHPIINSRGAEMLELMAQSRAVIEASLQPSDRQ
jgi:1-acyl-sn-glycerol-3-phosphate acyltransferase